MPFTWTDVDWGQVADPDQMNELGHAVEELYALQAQSSLDSVRVTTSGAFITTSTDGAENVKLRSVSLNLVAGELYRFHGQALYLAPTDSWTMEIHVGSVGGTMVGGIRLPAGPDAQPVTWDIEWPCAATVTSQIFFVLNRLSGSATINMYGLNDTFYNTYSNIDHVGAAVLLRDVP